MRALVGVAAALLLGGCLPPADLPPSDPATSFDPIRFFDGRTRGEGLLVTLTGTTTPIAVASRGTRQPDGSLLLVQRIEEGRKPPRVRRWTIKALGNGRYGGVLTDAVGAVEARVDRNRMDIAYETSGYRVRQTLVLDRAGRVHNRLDVHKWGLNVARLSETIVRQ